MKNAVVRLFCALAALALSSCSNNMTPSSESGPMAEGDLGTCASKDGKVYANGVECGPLTTWGCSDTEGCTPHGPIVAVYEGNFGTKKGALALANYDLTQDCTGNCAPLGVIFCGDTTVTLNGTVYTDRWMCAPVPGPVGAKCQMQGVPAPCEAGTTCDEIGKYPVYGLCVSCQFDSDCADTNPCNTDKCVVSTGVCQHPNLASGTSCDEGNKCNGTETCNGSGVCTAGTPLNCNDNKVCTNDSCVPATGCSNVNNTLACDDGSVCTLGDTCQGGTCLKGSDKDCDDGNPCMTDTCDSTLGCQHAPLANAAACNDGNKCSVSDACASGVCVGSAKNCGDNNPCTADSCSATDGVCSNLPLADGTACGEGNVCVAGGCKPAGDTCTPNGATACRQTGSTIGHYKCVIASGQTLGVWTLQAVCGPISTAKCQADTGCGSPSATEASCADGNDNDADGAIDCADSDCVGSTSCPSCTSPAQCDDANPCTTDLCNSGACAHPAKCLPTESCNATTGACAPACIPACSGKTCGADGCGGVCGTCAAGQVCSTSGTCSAPPANACSAQNPCPTGQFCGGGTCYLYTDLHGATDPDASGANGGQPDNKADAWDWDGDCYCAGSTCVGTSAASGACPALIGGDCDEIGTGNHPSAKDWVGDHYDNDCNGTVL